MKVFTLRRDQYLPISVEEAWAFFSLPANLAKITPPDVKFETLTDLRNKQLQNGMRIHYRLRPLMNIPLSWETEIREVNPPNKFMDKQVKGPYAFWDHTHTFTVVNGGVKMTDEVRYALPFGWLGVLMHPILVKSKLEGIFRFRETTLVTMFGEYRSQQ